MMWNPRVNAIWERAATRCDGSDDAACRTVEING